MRVELKLFASDDTPIVFMKSEGVSSVDALLFVRMLREYHAEGADMDKMFAAIELAVKAAS